MDSLRQLLELFGQGERFELLMEQRDLLVLLVFYLVVAGLAFLWVAASLVFGELTDAFDFLDFAEQGTFPALGIGVLIVCLVGSLAVIQGASSVGSALWGGAGGVVSSR